MIVLWCKDMVARRWPSDFELWTVTLRLLRELDATPKPCFSLVSTAQIERLEEKKTHGIKSEQRWKGGKTMGRTRVKVTEPLTVSQRG